MSFHSSRALSRPYGVFSAFAGSGGRTIFGPFKFGEEWSSDDFGTDAHFNQWVKPYLDQVPAAKGMTYVPPTTALITNSGAKMQAWQDAADNGAPGAQAYVDGITSKMKSLISQADQLSITTKGWPFVASREENIEVQRYNVFAAIVKVMKQVAASNPPTAIDASGNPVPVGAGTGVSSTYTVNPGSTGSSPVNNPQQNALNVSSQKQTAAGSSNTILYVGLGVGALALVGGLLYMRSRKAPAVAGYRRRSRR